MVEGKSSAKLEDWEVETEAIDLHEVLQALSSMLTMCHLAASPQDKKSVGQAGIFQN